MKAPLGKVRSCLEAAGYLHSFEKAGAPGCGPADNGGSAMDGLVAADQTAGLPSVLNLAAGGGMELPSMQPDPRRASVTDPDIMRTSWTGCDAGVRQLEGSFSGSAAPFPAETDRAERHGLHIS